MDSLARQKIHAKALAMLSDAGISNLPVKPIELAAHFDIDVHAKPPHMDGASGWLVRVGDAFTIVYATHIDNEGFQNFSVAHELGHYWLEGHPEHIFRNGTEHASRAGFGSTDPVEQEADYFAACLLMPATLCKALLRRNVDGLIAVKSMASSCRTSLEASAIRYVEIGGVPAAVILSTDGRVDYCSSGNLLKQIGWPKNLFGGSAVPKFTATWRLAQDAEAIQRGLEDSDSTQACDWFSGASTKSVLIEEAIGLGHTGRVLTLLTLEEVDEEDDEFEDSDEPRFR